MRYILAPTGEDPVGKVVIEGDLVTVVEGVIDPVVFQSLNRAMGKRLEWYKREGVGGCLKCPQSRLKWVDEICHQKGVEHALDHICDSFHFVVVGIYRWLYGWWTHSYPAGRCHHRRGDPSYSGTKVMVAIWTLAGEGEVFEKEVVSRSRRILPNLLIPSVEKVSQ
jgi:hypothetical protein